MSIYDFAIVRPYIGFPEESGGVDRYLTLHNQLNMLGVKTILICSSFSHIHRKTRSNITIEHIHFINAGTYNRNLSISRIFYEVKFSFLAFKLLHNLAVRGVLVGEPLFLAWFFMFFLRLYNKINLYSDFIDLMPEAAMIKFKNKFIYRILGFPFILSRVFRINFVYNKNFFVSKHYIDITKCIKNKNGGVFYWGCKNIFNAKDDGLRDPKCIIYAGSLGEGYDIETIIDLARVRPDLKIIIAGTGPKINLCLDAKNSGIIEFLGQVDSRSLDGLYKKASIGLMPYSRNSAVSMPIKFFDYIGAGLKIVNSLVDKECGEIIINHSIGTNYKAGDLASLMIAVDSAINMTVLPEEFFRLSTELYVQNQYRKFAKTIKELI
jgi:hypothetical protein